MSGHAIGAEAAMPGPHAISASCLPSLMAICTNAGTRRRASDNYTYSGVLTAYLSESPGRVPGCGL